MFSMVGILFFFFLFCFCLFLAVLISIRVTKAKLDPPVHPGLRVLPAPAVPQETQGKMDRVALPEKL